MAGATSRGLEAALTALAGRALLPVGLEIEHSRPASSQAEAAVYFVVAEALTNVARYAGATRATVHVADVVAEGGGDANVIAVTVPPPTPSSRPIRGTARGFRD